jgi:hypothetical protein
VIALLPDPRKSTYKFLFHELRNKAAELNMNFNPDTIMSDFEGALAEVVKSEVRIILLQFEQILLFSFF